MRSQSAQVRLLSFFLSVSRPDDRDQDQNNDDAKQKLADGRPKASSRQGAGTGTGAGSHSGSNPGLAQETACDESPDADLDSEPELGGALPAPNAGHDTHDSIAGLDLSATHVSGDRQATDGTMMMDFAYEDSEDSPQVDMDATNELLEGPGTAGHAHPTGQQPPPLVTLVFWCFFLSLRGLMSSCSAHGVLFVK